MEPIVIEISGKPIPYKRVEGGKFKPKFIPEHVRVWREAAGWFARQEMIGRPILRGCISLTVTAYFAPPNGWPAWKREAALLGEIEHTSKPDVDNIIKNSKDSLNGIVWVDDSQVVEEWGRKEYCDQPRVLLRITERETVPSTVKSRKEFDQLKGKDS